VPHANACLTPRGRAVLVGRIASGWRVSRAARAAGISRQTGSKWWNRYRREGAAGLVDRRSVVCHQARAHPAEVGERLCRLRREQKVGPHRLAWQTGLPRSTVYAVLRRHGLGRLDRLEPRPPVIRHERAAPGELLHLDTKQLGRIGAGGGKRVDWSLKDRHRGSAGIGSMSRSTTTAASPTSRSWSKRSRSPRSAFCAGRWPSTPATASPSNAC
jgi:transposase